VVREDGLEGKAGAPDDANSVVVVDVGGLVVGIEDAPAAR